MEDKRWTPTTKQVRETFVLSDLDMSEQPSLAWDRIITIEGFDRWLAEHDAEVSAKKSVISDQQINSMAQYLYEGINLSPDVRLVMDMTSKATLVKVLRQVLIRAGVIGDDQWSIVYMHHDCAQCEQCADLAVESAKRRYLVSDQYTVMIPAGDGTPTVGHRAVVERVL